MNNQNQNQNWIEKMRIFKDRINPRAALGAVIGLVLVAASALLLSEGGKWMQGNLFQDTSTGMKLWVEDSALGQDYRRVNTGFDVDVYFSTGTSGHNLSTIQLFIDYDENVLRFDSIENGGTGSGTLDGYMNIIPNLSGTVTDDNNGEVVKIVAYSHETAGITGSRLHLARVHFTPLIADNPPSQTEMKLMTNATIGGTSQNSSLITAVATGQTDLFGNLTEVTSGADYNLSLFTIYPENTAPVFDSLTVTGAAEISPGNYQATEGSQVEVTITASDIDIDRFGGAADQLIYSASTLNGANISTNTWQWTPTHTQGNDGGPYNVTFKVSDLAGGAGTLSDQQILQFTVGDVNFDPVITDITPVTQSVNEGVQATVNFTVSDPDPSDTPVCTLTPSFGTLTDCTSWTWTPTSTDSGTHNFTLSVEDGNGGATSGNFSVSVNNVNQPIILNNPGPQGFDENVERLFAVNVDAGTIETEDVLYWTAQGPTGASFSCPQDSQSCVMTWNPGFEAEGSYTADITVFDRDPQDAAMTTIRQSATITVSITVGNTNRAPVWSLIPPISATEGDTVTLDISNYVNDADGDTLTYSMAPAPGSANTEGATLSTDGVFTWNTDADTTTQDAEFRVIFSASDALVTETQTLSIQIGNANRAPYFNPALVNRSVLENGFLAFDVTALDLDGDTYTIIATGLPTRGTGYGGAAGASFVFSEATRVGHFYWQPDYTTANDSNSTDFPVTFIVTDGTSSYSEEITITVGDVNRPPVLNPIGPQYTDVNQELTVNFSATDPDGDILIFRVENPPPGSIFEQHTDGNGALLNSAELRWTPDMMGTWESVSIVIDDGGTQNADAKKQDAEVWRIIVGGANQPPVFADIGHQHTFTDTEPVSINITASDGDNNNLTFAITSSDSNDLTLNQTSNTTATLSSASALPAGNYAVELEVTDDGVDRVDDGGALVSQPNPQSDTLSLNITVGHVNIPPYWTNNFADVDIVYTTPNTEFVMVTPATDSDGNQLTFEMTGTPQAGLSYDPVARELSGTPTEEGAASLTFTVTDDGSPNLSTEHTITLIVGQAGASGDADADGLLDQWEMDHFGNLAQNPTDDYDDDGLTNMEELIYGTDPTISDHDDDGLLDGEEIMGCILEKDGQGAVTQPATCMPGTEFTPTNPLDLNSNNTSSNTDTDGDGMPDWWEDRYLTTVLVDQRDPEDDPDNDGLTNLEEYQAGTIPTNNDTDGDGILDGDDNSPLDPYLGNPADTDNDGMPDDWEQQICNWMNDNGQTCNDASDVDATADPDNDGLTNLEEYILGTDPVDDDTDNDNVTDGDEIAAGTDPNDPDTDNDGTNDDIDTTPVTDSENGGTGDGLPDWWEEQICDWMNDNGQTCTGPADVDPVVDTDSDGLSNADEYLAGINPVDEDSDGDGVIDGDDPDPLDPDVSNMNDDDNDGLPNDWENNNGLDPNDPSDSDDDTDNDDLTNLQEYNLGTDPQVADTDGDGLLDGDEIATGTDPTNPDTDGDGTNDGDEVANGTDPTDDDSTPNINEGDTDNDGLPDWWEIDNFGGLDQGPADDTDGDGLINSLELDYGTDPNNSDSDNDGLLDGEEVMGCELTMDVNGTTVAIPVTCTQTTFIPTDPTDSDSDDDDTDDGTEVTDNDPNTNPVEDSDGDGLPDSWEDQYMTDTDFANNNDPNDDPDNDGLTNQEEYNLGTDPTDDDTDDDGLLDGEEIDGCIYDSGTTTCAAGSDFIPTDPTDPDTDNDGTNDNTDTADPAADTDNGGAGDGLPDWWEEYYWGTNGAYDGTDDPDNDGLSNTDELDNGTDPTDADSDNDGVNDGLEVQYGTDPTDSDEVPDIPLAQSAATSPSGQDITITFSRALASTTVVPSAFSFSGTTSIVDSVSISGTDVTLILDNAVAPTDTIRVSYIPTGNAANDLQSDSTPAIPAAAFTNLAVTNNVSANDIDGDSLPDDWEQAICNWMNGNQVGSCNSVADIDPSMDNDNDQLSNGLECHPDFFTQQGSGVVVTCLATNDPDYADPTSSDTDSDSLDDGEERGQNGLGTESNNPDTDGDTITDGDEIAGWDITYSDTSGNTQTTHVTSNPTNPDTDGDGVSDGDEQTNGTNPTLRDTDGDGLYDNQDPSPADGQVGADIVAPTVTGATALGSGMVQVTFSEDVQMPANVASAFTISGLTIHAANTVSTTEVLLTTSDQAPGQSYTLTVAATVRDLAGNQLDQANNTAAFTGFGTAAAAPAPAPAPATTSSSDTTSGGGGYGNRSTGAEEGDKVVIDTLPGTTVAGDMDGDGTVTFDDFTIFSQYYAVD